MVEIIINGEVYIPVDASDRNYPIDFLGGVDKISDSQIWLKKSYTLANLWAKRYYCLSQVAGALLEKYPLAAKNPNIIRWLSA